MSGGMTGVKMFIMLIANMMITVITVLELMIFKRSDRRFLKESI